MKPKKPERSEAEDLFRARLQNIIAPKHPLVRLADETDWGFFEAAIEPLYAEHGRPGVPVRFMVGLHILKHTFNLSDEEVGRCVTRGCLPQRACPGAPRA